MDIKDINTILRTKAIKAGLCEDWQNNKWNKVLTKDELLELYIKGIDFSLKQEWFDYDFIKVAFNKEDLHRHNIYLDENVAIEDAQNGYYVFLGKCTGTLWVNGLKAVTVYVRHDSVINVEAFDGARVQVRYYDNSDGACKSDSYSRVKKIISKL